MTASLLTAEEIAMMTARAQEPGAPDIARRTAATLASQSLEIAKLREALGAFSDVGARFADCADLLEAEPHPGHTIQFMRTSGKRYQEAYDAARALEPKAKE